MDLFGFSVMLLIAVIVGFMGDALTSSDIPFGWLAAIVVGAIGSLVGTALLGGLGPELGGIYLLPAILGAVVFVALLEFTLSTFVVRAPS